MISSGRFKKVWWTELLLVRFCNDRDQPLIHSPHIMQTYQNKFLINDGPLHWPYCHILTLGEGPPIPILCLLLHLYHFKGNRTYFLSHVCHTIASLFLEQWTYSSRRFLYLCWSLPQFIVWLPGMSIYLSSIVIQALVALVHDPEPEHPLRADVAEEYTKNRSKYEKNAEEYTKKHAEKRPAE